MAKIVFDNVWIAAVKGPLGNLRWRSKSDAEGEVKAEGKGPRKPSEVLVDPRQPFLVSPATYKCECKAWKVADATYTKIREAVHLQWRAAIVRPGRSSYDGYMKQAIPHLLRGYPAPDLPIQNTGWSLQRLKTPHVYLAGGVEPGATAIPPDQCQTNGLHWLRVDYAMHFHRAVSATVQKWCCRVAWDAYTGAHPRPRLGYISFGVFRTRDLSDLVGYANVGLVESVTTCKMDFDDQGHWVYLGWWPVKRNEDGTPVGNLMPALNQATIVYWLCPAYTFKHWPRYWPSRKPDFHPPPAPYPSWPAPTFYDWYVPITE